MGLFDGLTKIAGALSDKPSQGTGGTINKVGYGKPGDFDLLRAGKIANMAKMGLNPDGSPMKAAPTNKLLTPKRTNTILKGNIP